MTVVRFKNRPNGAVSFNNLLSDVFPPMPSLYRDEARHTIPVNIKETEKEFLIDLIAPGLNKEDFKIILEKDLLTVAAEKKQEGQKDGEKVIRNEYKIISFKRSFTIDEKVQSDSIAAQYVNGVLTLNLPKRIEVKPATKQINIS